MRPQSKGFSEDYRDPNRFKQVSGEILIGFNLVSVGRFLADCTSTTWINIECSFWGASSNTVGLVEHGNHHVPAFLKCRIARLYESLITV